MPISEMLVFLERNLCIHINLFPDGEKDPESFQMESSQAPELGYAVPTGKPTTSKKSICPHCEVEITAKHLKRHIRRYHSSNMPSAVRSSSRDASKLVKEKLQDNAVSREENLDAQQMEKVSNFQPITQMKPIVICSPNY